MFTTACCFCSGTWIGYGLAGRCDMHVYTGTALRNTLLTFSSSREAACENRLTAAARAAWDGCRLIDLPSGSFLLCRRDVRDRLSPVFLYFSCILLNFRVSTHISLLQDSKRKNLANTFVLQVMSARGIARRKGRKAMDMRSLLRAGADDSPHYDSRSHVNDHDRRNRRVMRDLCGPSRSERR